MVSRTLVRYFGMRFLGAVAVGVRRHLRADRAGRLRRADAARLRRAEPVGLDGREDLVLPRAAADRTAAAVLRAGRRDGLLSRAVAAQRTGGARSAGMSAWQFVAPGRDRRVRDRARRDRGLQSARRRHARSVQAARGGDFRRQAVRPAGSAAPASGCASAATTASRSSTRRSQEQGVRLDKVSVFTFDPPASRSSASRPSAPSLEPGHWRLDQAASMSAARRRAITTPIWSRPT